MTIEFAELLWWHWALIALGVVAAGYVLRFLIAAVVVAVVVAAVATGMVLAFPFVAVAGLIETWRKK